MLRGVVPILMMPFNRNGDIDHGALANEVEYVIDAGVDAVGTGIGSESLMLTEDERDAVAKTVATTVRGRIPFVMSCGGDSTRIARQRARRASAAGSDAALLLPPTFVPFPADALAEHIAAVAGEIPVMIQDADTRVEMPTEWLQHVCRTTGVIGAKIEVTGSVEKIGSLAKALPQLAVFGGSGGVAYREETSAGSKGTMPGPAGIEVFVATKRAMDDGRPADEFEAIQPLLAWLSGQTGLFIWAQKQVLVERGVISLPDTRIPTDIPPDATEHIARLLAELPTTP